MASLFDLPTRDKDGALRVVVESPRGSTLKLKYEPELGAFTLSRPLVLGLAYPYDFGFIPGTRAQDGDPLDALVFWDGASYPGLVLACRALGVLKVEQREEGGGRVRNDRLIATPVKAPREEHLRSVGDLSKRQQEELAQFFLSAVFFTGKEPKILGWGDHEAAEAIVSAALTPGR
jgi:inorganic pyrophosphatase